MNLTNRIQLWTIDLKFMYKRCLYWCACNTLVDTNHNVKIFCSFWAYAIVYHISNSLEIVYSVCLEENTAVFRGLNIQKDGTTNRNVDVI